MRYFPVVALVAALLLTLFVSRQYFARTADYRDVARIVDSLRSGGIQSGGDSKLLDVGGARMRELAAAADEAASNNRALNVVLLRQPTAPAASREVALNMHDLGETGFLVVFDRPLGFKASNAPAGARAKIAFESEARFDMDDMPRGLVAGFRRGDFGLSRAIKTSDFFDGPHGGPNARFCVAMRRWTEFFGAKYGEARLWTYDAGDELELSADRVAVRGQPAQWPRSIALDCQASLSFPGEFAASRDIAAAMQRLR